MITLGDVGLDGRTLFLQPRVLEIGARSVATPVRDAAGRTVAAIDISTPVGRTNLNQVREECAPQLLDHAAREFNSPEEATPIAWSTPRYDSLGE